MLHPHHLTYEGALVQALHHGLELLHRAHLRGEPTSDSIVVLNTVYYPT